MNLSINLIAYFAYTKSQCFPRNCLTCNTNFVALYKTSVQSKSDFQKFISKKNILVAVNGWFIAV